MINFLKKILNYFKKTKLDVLPSMDDIVGEITTEFVIITIDNGSVTQCSTNKQGVIDYLQNYRESLTTFQKYNWLAGEWMQYPCGWIFCVSSKEPINN